ncbi:hypothetical protein K466DRAFT_603256 [Polyporus arcularius HHB13444]|uniref:F-box domain-containing protein n=1 Tax=Polyporus arcularius HHB13444 TaxID=1314778 RepID=A0A5C3NZW7_9APHY|nr:hypothetical protein K466DRAFT_603256 [Polyporus arcularius HHB13444]
MFSITPLTPPEETLPGKVGSHAAPAIPDDILPEILHHLSFQDRLKMALLSKHVRQIIPLRVTDVVLRCPEQSSALCDYITADSPNRAPHLRSIRVLWAPESQSRYQAYVDMSTMGEAIRKAPHLRELQCTAWLLEVVSLKDVQGLDNLTTLKLAGWPSKLQDLSSLPAKLRSLSFTSKPDDDSYSPSYSPSFADLVRSISHLSFLHTLLLQDMRFVTEDNWTWPAPEDGALPVLPSLTTLRLLSVVLPWTTADPLKAIFPNLSAVDVAYNRVNTLISRRHNTRRNGPESPFVIRHLQLASDPLAFDSDPTNFIPSSWKVNRLILHARTSDDIELVGLSRESVDELAHLTVDTTAARGLTFATFADVMHVMASWAVPLRSLEFVSRNGDFTELISDITNAYSETNRKTAAVKFPLLCLSIRATTQAEHAPWKIVFRRDQFLEAVSNWFPSLRYIALADIPDGFDGNDDEKPHWWRVLRDDEGSPVEVREVPLWEGRRVRDYFLDADADTAAQFEERFVPRW